jgi:putative restriction endonuclease
MPEAADSFEQAVEALYALNVGIIGQGADRHERPHKPVMLLAVLDMIAQGRCTPDRVVWCQALRERFTAYFEVVRKLNDQDTPENPFLYLRQERWWQPLRQTSTGWAPLASTPLVGDFTGEKVTARISAPLSVWMINPLDRLRLRDALISRYFPHARPRLVELFQESVMREAPPPDSSTETDDAEGQPGRSSGFRRLILEAYDYQCAACGLRIRLPQLDDLTFVDAAHLIPFSDRDLGGNDHPTNGMALCKNHHWAMDRSLIAPAPDGDWKVSRFIDPRRSAGEAELHALHQKPLLLPRDDAFHPSPDALQWRLDRLAA